MIFSARSREGASTERPHQLLSPAWPVPNPASAQQDTEAGLKVADGLNPGESERFNSEQGVCNAVRDRGNSGARANKFFKSAQGDCSNFQVARLDDGTVRVSYDKAGTDAGHGKTFVKLIDQNTGEDVDSYSYSHYPTGYGDFKHLGRFGGATEE